MLSLAFRPLKHSVRVVLATLYYGGICFRPMLAASAKRTFIVMLELLVFPICSISPPTTGCRALESTSYSLNLSELEPALTTRTRLETIAMQQCKHKYTSEFKRRRYRVQKYARCLSACLAHQVMNTDTSTQKHFMPTESAISQLCEEFQGCFEGFKLNRTPNRRSSCYGPCVYIYGPN